MCNNVSIKSVHCHVIFVQVQERHRCRRQVEGRRWIPLRCGKAIPEMCWVMPPGGDERNDIPLSAPFWTSSDEVQYI